MKLPRTETLIFWSFLVCILLWGLSKCNAKRADLARQVRDFAPDKETDEKPAQTDTVYVPTQPAPSPTNASRPSAAPITSDMPAMPNANSQKKTGPAPSKPAPAAPKPVEQSNKPAAKQSVLYVTIDGWNVREKPSLKSKVIAKLKLDEEVYFLNKKSEKPEEISLGYEKVTDYWVKIRTKSGKEGWVFGAGVHYFKMKRKGVIQ